MNKRVFSLLLVVVGVALVLAACGGQATQAPTAAPTDAPTVAPTEAPTEAPVALSGDAIRGGLLYDDWIKALGVDTPADNQALWATQTTNARSGKDSWRCKECHGWDYLGKDGVYGKGSHATGFVGVNQVAGTDANVILAALKGETNPDHDFSAVMDDQALTDIALFLSEYQFDSPAFIGADKKTTSGDAAAGQTVYEENCTDCHGPEGLSMNFADDAGPEYFGTIASDNPWEFVHKARFGQPNVADMPSLVDVGVEDAAYADLLAYAQTLPTSSPVAEGAHLYDNWMKAIGVEAPAGDQPLWATQTTNTRTGADTWRCKECHGWDYLGADGRYGSGSHQTGFPGLISSAGKTPEELTAALKGENHDFSAYLNDGQMTSLVAFVKQMQDLKTYVNDDKTVNGDAEKGKSLYTAQCSACHGDDGKTLNFGDEAAPEFVGTLAADNPWEGFNKIAYGQPSEPMPAGIGLGWSWQDIADVLAYAQTLPIK